ncbi:sulfotransferase 6B1-like [Eublepharis macularius]|uniref:Sulfotransferase n=1 Tax=Eublepharis macularius TaxID=481883 RepID=A0AA97JCI0_EUBMA|nr:sulfotransferase 6B1-like [Eublepharis macularius]
MTSDRKMFVETVDKAIAEAEDILSKDKLFSYKSVLFPKAFCSPETFKALESFEARSDDIFLAGYPKTGTNWFIHILCDLVRTVKKSKDEWNKGSDDSLYLEFGDPGKFERMKNLPSRQVLGTHLLPHMLPESIFKNKAKVLVLFRNPKDVAASYFHFSNRMPTLPSFKTWNEFFRAFMEGKVARGSYFDYLVEWNKYIDEKNVKFITYEEMKMEPKLGMKKIADFLGFSVNEEEIQMIIERSNFQEMKKNSKCTHGNLGDILFRKGGVGDWKNIFSETQSQEMDKKIEESFTGTKLYEIMKYEI